MSQEPFGWCFIGSGSITRRVFHDFPQMQGARVVSVYSRNFENARIRAEETGAVPYPTLEEAVCAPGVRAVYVATTNDMHYEHTMAALRLGKPVLCEKPFALNLREAAGMIDTARAKGLYLAEGMWIRFNPVIRQALAWIEEGRIGAVRSVESAFCSKTPASARRVFELSMGGGGLMDLGVYTVAIARFIFGKNPAALEAVASLTQGGVDSQLAATLRYEGGGIARLYTSVEAPADNDIRVYGEEGWIVMDNYPFTREARLIRNRKTQAIYTDTWEGEGFAHEFNAVMEDIRGGRLENGLVPHAHTLDVMETMDQIRARVGVVFEADKP